MPISYQGIWTEYFSDFCQRHAAEDSQIFGVLSDMPDDLNGTTFEERFKQRNWHKEIGSETEELFMMEMAVKFDEVIERYGWKIAAFQARLNTILDRYEVVTVADSDVASGTDSGSEENLSYLNPINAGNSAVLTGKTERSNSVTHGKTVTMNRNKVLQFAYNENNATLMKEIMSVEAIYEEALEYLDRLFMVIL